MVMIVRGFAAVVLAVCLAACTAEPPARQASPTSAPGPSRTPSTSPTSPTSATPATPATRGACRAGCDTAKARDYNGDGYADLAIGAPGEPPDEGRSTRGGYVVVSYGGARGLDPRRRTVLRPGQGGLPRGFTEGENFGASSAGGDFDGDGYADLAIGASSERSDGPVAVTIVFGGRDGLSARSAVLITHEDPTFGELLAAGDFNGDGHQDLGVTTVEGAWVVYGSAGMRRQPPRPRMVRRTSAVNALAAGDVTGDRIDDLVVAFSDDDPADEGTGAVHRGSPAGLKGVAGPTFDAWGVGALAVGDVDGDGFGDVIAGNAYADADDAGGQIFLHRGSASGPAAEGVLISQNSSGVPEDSGDGDGFGGDLAVGDVNGDGYADVAVGASGKFEMQGAVFLLHGGRGGLPGDGAQVLKPGDAGFASDVQGFGASLRLADFDKDGRADLAVTTRTEPLVAVLAASREGVRTTKPLLIGPEGAGTPGEGSDFGRSLT
ncbi:FG-GAP-like repeat-containing protein [Nonomuraea rhodomycinica]|uniref:FG-GAP repeat protein n=1 Tax=Nonomuraea rhodomycinica TaxID=1712872 RepID=A0A7Y6IZ99_9ACTN|nr:FG-GAP-like repeat-containing protein [Nonomuraea rhodomycinica]NUW46643.1 FG-GAP repeat protein [Nonomuraea rhodomycinica]